MKEQKEYLMQLIRKFDKDFKGELELEFLNKECSIRKFIEKLIYVDFPNWLEMNQSDLDFVVALTGFQVCFKQVLDGLELTKEDLLNDRVVRLTMNEVLNKTSNIDEINRNYKKCSICGYYYKNDNGVSNYKKGYISEKYVCNDCITLMDEGIARHEIPFEDNDSLFKLGITVMTASVKNALLEKNLTEKYLSKIIALHLLNKSDSCENDINYNLEDIKNNEGRVLNRYNNKFKDIFINTYIGKENQTTIMFVDEY